jgi:hypothetical protein
MKSTKFAILGYKPEPPPADLPPSAQRYLDTELNRIASVLQALLSPPMIDMLQLKPMAAEPATPTVPMIVYTDGIAWNPGSGAGYYYWNGVAWTPLG